MTQAVQPWHALGPSWDGSEAPKKLEEGDNRNVGYWLSHGGHPTHPQTTYFWNSCHVNEKWPTLLFCYYWDSDGARIWTKAILMIVTLNLCWITVFFLSGQYSPHKRMLSLQQSPPVAIKDWEKSCSWLFFFGWLDLHVLLLHQNNFSLITATEQVVLVKNKSGNRRILRNFLYWWCLHRGAGT